jgi:hypothetical protein
MANVTIGGFRPVGTLSGASLPTPMVREVANNYGTALGVGDVLAAATDGTVTVAAASQNGALLGYATGFSYVVSGKREYKNYLPANTTFSPTTVGSRNASLVEFIPATPDVICAVQATAATNTTIAAWVGTIQSNADLTAGTPDATTGQSTFSLDATTVATTTANFRIVGIRGYSLAGLELGQNDPSVIRFEVLVVCSESCWCTGTATGV